MTNPDRKAALKAFERLGEYIYLLKDPEKIDSIVADISIVRQALQAPCDELGQRFTADYDDFTGTVIGSYKTREGKEGLVLQQDGTRVVHVYGRKRLTRKDQGDE